MKYFIFLFPFMALSVYANDMTLNNIEEWYFFGNKRSFTSGIFNSSDNCTLIDEKYIKMDFYLIRCENKKELEEIVNLYWYNNSLGVDKSDTKIYYNFCGEIYGCITNY
ncbi:hypothetical protein ACEN3H_05355 [Acinetobacter lactucae]|uniref:hypothetical protein n=1 Tax=Acinetobacter lactucae TaxID=1785128 RepID=UPI00358DA9BF